MPSSEPKRCAVCAAEEGLVGVVVAGRALLLCPTHHQAVVAGGEERFNDLEAFFAHPDFERRHRGDRRRRARRQFPPRPEGRRHNRGRRVDDLQ